MAEAVKRSGLWKTALVCVVGIEPFGGLSGWLSNSGTGNGWFDALRKPSFMPPGWTFGVVWPVLYAMLGVALAMVLVEPSSDRRRFALILFFIQLVLNLAWSPIFFALHQIALAKWVIFVMAAVAAAAAGQFLRVKRDAGVLMIPYLGWLVFAAMLNSTIEALNSGVGASLPG
jgi:tryptophan-rich sensory protein